MKPTRNVIKIFAAAVLAAALPFCASACRATAAADKKEPDTRSPAASENKEKGDDGMEKIRMNITDSFVKVKPGSEIAEGSDYELFMAKNESESCQIILRSAEKAQNLSFKVKASGGQGIKTEFLREYYIETQSGVYYPDPAAPLSGKFTLAENSNLVFILRFTAAPDASAGTYDYEIALMREGEKLGSARVTLHVWDFALPEGSACATAVGLYPEFINKMHGITLESKQKEMYKKYYDFLLNYRVCAYALPYDILDERADAYLDDPRVTNFVIPYSDDDETIRAYYKKLSSKEEWQNKAVFYPLDEPTSAAQLDKLREICERLSKLYPDFRLTAPFFTDIQYGKDADQIDFMTGLSNVWCPKSFLYKTDILYSAEQAAKYPPFADRMAERQKKGDEVWWYVCWEPSLPYLNVFVDMDGLFHRLLFWQQKLYNVRGFLYWGADYWAGTDDPWIDMRTVKQLSMDVFGDGSLLYNGNKAGIDGPAGSLRLEIIRDGIEDFDLLTLAEKHLGKEYTDGVIKEITTSVTEYKADGRLLKELRVKIGSALEKALKG